MKKIGIITYHCVDNYGAVLQAYSLLDTTKKLSEMDVEVIDYRPIEITQNYSFSIIPKNKSVVKLFSNLFSYPFKKIKNNKFLKFTTDFINLSNNSENIQWKEYDYVITGSDQVWNPSITRLAPYYLNFPDLKSKKISYAASIGKDILSSKEINYLSNSIQFVDSISVREESAVTIIKDMYPNKRVVQVLDPVFLKSKSEWLSILPKKQRFSDYILIYIMEYNIDLFELATKLARQKNKKILIVSPNANIKTFLKSIKLPGKVLYTEGPIEFLDLIVKADYVITNSFHGTAFSIIFEKKFITFPHGSRNTRLESILTQLDILSQQICNERLNNIDAENIEELFNYNIESVSTRLNTLKIKSLEFLKVALDK